MKPYHKLTIVRNRHRARDLRIFRELVESYFEQAEYVADDLPVDWEGARTARSQINRMLPRVIQIVHAAELDAQTATTTDPGVTVAEVGSSTKSSTLGMPKAQTRKSSTSSTWHSACTKPAASTPWRERSIRSITP